MLSPFAGPIGPIAVVYAHVAENEDGSPGRPYEIAASVVDPDGRRRDFRAVMRRQGLGIREYHRSGLPRAEVEAAAQPTAVGEDLREFLGRDTLLFVLDDYRSLETVTEFCGRSRAVDLGFAAEFLIPSLGTVTARSAWEYLRGAPRVKIAMSAAEGVETGLELLRHLCEHVLCTDHVAHAPVIRHFLQRSDTLLGTALLHVHRSFQRYFGGLFDPSSTQDTDNWRAFLPRAIRNPAREDDDGPIRPVALDNLENLYGALGAVFPDFKVRKEQVEYARHVAGALNDQAILTLEAGTGTGKTQGYLVPVLEFLRRNPSQRVVISTYTKNLQDQLFQKELVRTREALPHYREVRVALLKGKSSYLCAEKLDAFHDESLTGADLLSWLYCLLLVFAFRQADPEALGDKVRHHLDRRGRLFRLIRELSAATGCTPGHGRCPAQIVTGEALAADLVVTNHHKLALLDRDSVLAGRFRHYVIDEANHFEAAVRNATGKELRSQILTETLAYLEIRANRFQKRGDPVLTSSMTLALAAVAGIRESLAGFHAMLSTLAQHATPGASHILPYEHAVFSDGRVTGDLTRLLEGIRRLRELFDFMGDEKIVTDLRLPDRTQRRLTAALEELDACQETIGVIRRNIVQENNITAFQLFGRHWSLVTQWVEMGGLIREEIHDRKGCVVYTAATIRHKGRFDGFRQIMGMDLPPGGGLAPREFRFHQIPSPFDKSRRQIVVPPQAVSGKFTNKDAWADAVAAAVPALIRENGGRTLVLFSSYRDLDTILRRTRHVIEADQFPLLVQKPGQPTTALCDEFRVIRESVLFGVDTFWYGVDFRGDTLTQVIITRIPYPPPGDPVQTARKKLLPPNDYWRRYYYDTEIKLRQGIGRLIRGDTDRGRVVILDNRFRNGMDREIDG